jgi:hypothetical protein
MALSLVALSFQAKAQLADGVYLAQTGTVKNLILIKDHYLSFINYDDINKHFGYTWGGPIRQQSDQISLVTEYDSKDTTQVGKEVNLNYQKKADAILIKLPDSEGQFIKQKNIPQQLDALWRITGRQQEAKMHDIPRSERKTIKILVDGYFQWIAINPAKKGFYGTGGGHYNYSNNRYSEKIQFFSRDNSRVGHELHFNGSLVDNKWHHSGKSSKGDDIYEIWSKETAK